MVSDDTQKELDAIDKEIEEMQKQTDNFINECKKLCEEKE